MPSTAVSQIIFFIASIVVATMVVGGLFVVTQDFTDALEDRGHTNAEKLRTRILIVNDPVAMPYNNTTGELHVYVKNIGMREIGMGSIAILLDGRP
ncbi:MAG TPA: flagellar protein G, partial [Thermoplasmata archaeon]|nr:flagellar protein G [Thermoplasmata archaeon]